MKTNAILGVLLCTFLLLIGCGKDKDDDKNTGFIKFKMVNPTSSSKKESINFKHTSSNPALVGDTTLTILTNIKACIGDIWVSQGEVIDGQADNLQWVRLTSVTNTQLQNFETYSFAQKEIPIGTYKSIKITLKNIFYWVSVLDTDSTVKYEILQTMGSALDPCDENDDSWARTNYFSTDGNHILNDNGVFELVSSGEKVGGFKIEAGKIATVSWRWLMRGCILKLLDLNQNLIFDCGIDDTEMVCTGQYMFDFVVDYE
jgi:hypothetical protein